MTNIFLNSDFDFVKELDKLKSVVRQSRIYHENRRENTAEHSWHLAMSVWALRSYSNEPLQLERALKFALIHDVPEIDAGDTFVYDTQGLSTKAQREQNAANRIFSISGIESLAEMKSLWFEYETQKCIDSRFVNAVDRFLPIFANFLTEGYSWVNHGIKKEQVLERNRQIALGSRRLWEIALRLIEVGVERKHLSSCP